MSKLIVIKSNDEIELLEYEDWRSLQKAVGGSFEHLKTTDTKLMNEKEDYISFYGNEEALLINNEDNNRINAVATKMLNIGCELYGNIVVAKLITTEDGDKDSRGFDYEETDGEMDICETWFMKDKIENFIMKHKSEIASLHEKYDNNKPEPFFEFYSF